MKHLRIHILIQRICCTALRCVSDDTEQDFWDAILPVLPLPGFPQDPFPIIRDIQSPVARCGPSTNSPGRTCFRAERRRKKKKHRICSVLNRIRCDVIYIVCTSYICRREIMRKRKEAHLLRSNLSAAAHAGEAKSYTYFVHEVCSPKGPPDAVKLRIGRSCTTKFPK